VRQTGGIGNSLEAKVLIRASGETAGLLRRHSADLRYIFIVSRVDIGDPGFRGWFTDRGFESRRTQMRALLELLR